MRECFRLPDSWAKSRLSSTLAMVPNNGLDKLGLGVLDKEDKDEVGV